MKSLMKYINWIIVACAALALVMIFLPAIKATGSSTNGIKVTFGSKDDGFGFSILNLIMYLAVIAVIVCGVLLQKKGNNKVLTIVVIACAAVAAILFFLSTSNWQFTSEMKDWADAMGASKKDFDKEMSLGIGAILGALFSVLACAAGVLKLVFDKE